MFQGFNSPGGTGFGVAAQVFGRKAVEHEVVGRVYRYQLALQVGRKFSDLHAAGFHAALEVVAVVFAFCGFFQVDQATVPGRDLHADVAQRSGPFADTFEGIEGSLVAHELCQENSGAFDCLHDS